MVIDVGDTEVMTPLASPRWSPWRPARAEEIRMEPALPAAVAEGTMLTRSPTTRSASVAAAWSFVTVVVASMAKVTVEPCLPWMVIDVGDTEVTRPRALRSRPRS